MEDFLRMKNIYKKFPNVVAVNDVNFSLREGEVHGLIGENGAGKSTLMNILYGLCKQDYGEIIYCGNKVEIDNPREAINLGIAMVHQEFMLSPEMTILENIILGFETERYNIINFQEARKKIRKLSSKYGLTVNPDDKVQEITVGEAQRVEILKAIYRGADVLILDEPTAVLTPQETDELFKIIKTLIASNKTIIFISHKLDEILKITNRITVMRDGRRIDTITNEEADEKKLAKLMVGREVFLDLNTSQQVPGKTVLKVKNLSLKTRRELSSLNEVSFNVKAGEIFGIAGVEGNGQNELIEVLTGLRKTDMGEILLNNKKITNKSPLEIRNKGIGHIPQDRNKNGLCKEKSISDNLIANKLFKRPFSKGILINYREVERYTNELISSFNIQPSYGEIKTKNLSGGNAQKVIVAREVSEKADLLIACHPTRGLDIGSME